MGRIQRSPFGGTVWAIMKTPMAVAGILAALCDNIIPGTDEERGIKVSKG